MSDDEQVDRRAVHAGEVGDRDASAAWRRGRRRAGRPRSRACPTITTPIVHTYTTRTSEQRARRDDRHARALGLAGPLADPQRDAHEREREQEVAHHAHPRELHLDRDAAERSPRTRRARRGSTRAARGRGGGAGAGTRRARVSASGMPIAPGEDAVDLLDRGVVRRRRSRTASRCSWASPRHPRPELVSRTIAPLTMIATRSTTFTVVSRRKRDRRQAGHAHRRQCRKGRPPARIAPRHTGDATGPNRENRDVTDRAVDPLPLLRRVPPVRRDERDRALAAPAQRALRRADPREPGPHPRGARARPREPRRTLQLRRAARAAPRTCVGIEHDPRLVQKAEENLAFYDVPRRDYEFVAGDMFERIRSVEPCDIVFCFGILYHINDHMRLLTELAEFDPRTIIFDTNVSLAEGAVIELRSPLAGSPPPVGSQIEGWPSRSALEAMWSSLGWTFEYFDWAGSGLADHPKLGDYAAGRRAHRGRHVRHAATSPPDVRAARGSARSSSASATCPTQWLTITRGRVAVRHDAAGVARLGAPGRARASRPPSRARRLTLRPRAAMRSTDAVTTPAYDEFGLFHENARGVRHRAARAAGRAAGRGRRRRRRAAQRAALGHGRARARAAARRRAERAHLGHRRARARPAARRDRSPRSRSLLAPRRPRVLAGRQRGRGRDGRARARARREGRRRHVARRAHRARAHRPRARPRALSSCSST